MYLFSRHGSFEVMKKAFAFLHLSNFLKHDIYLKDAKETYILVPHHLKLIYFRNM